MGSGESRDWSQRHMYFNKYLHYIVTLLHSRQACKNSGTDASYIITYTNIFFSELDPFTILGQCKSFFEDLRSEVMHLAIPQKRKCFQWFLFVWTVNKIRPKAFQMVLKIDTKHCILTIKIFVYVACPLHTN